LNSIVQILFCVLCVNIASLREQGSPWADAMNTKEINYNRAKLFHYKFHFNLIKSKIICSLADSIERMRTESKKDKMNDLK